MARRNSNSWAAKFRFEAKVTDILRADNGQIEGVVLDNGEVIHSRHVVLALGHSARDTFRMLHKNGVYIEAKPLPLASVLSTRNH